MAQGKDLNVAAVYKSDTSQPFTITNGIPRPSSSSVADKAQYLNALRQTLSVAQDQINKELTARMEEDKSRANVASKGVDDAREEENYGEEVQEED